MKQASCNVKLSKDHEVILHNVTPIEALILVAEHHKNAGGNPLEVISGTEKETGHKVAKEVEEEVDSIVVKDGEKVVETTKQKVTKMITESDNRTEDQEVARLRGKYDAKKIKAVLTEVRNLPKTFEEALKQGIALRLPTGAMTEHKF